MAQIYGLPTNPHQLKQRVIYTRSVRQEETTSRAVFVEEEQLLLLSDFAMIPTSSLLKELFVVPQLLLVWERNAVDTLQRVVVGIAKEVRGRVLQTN